MSARAREEIDALYRGHRDEVYRFLLRDLRDPDEAEDVTQTAFLHAYRSVLRGRRPERPRAWLLTIADNLRRRRFVRAAGRPREISLDDVELAEAERPSVDELRAALEQLPLNQRAALVLREVAGFSYSEIARRLGVSVGSVQMLLFRARRDLRDELRAASQRVASLLPPWLTHAFGHGDRLLLPGRAAGVGLAIAIAATASAGGPAPVSADPVQRATSPPATTQAASPEQASSRPAPAETLTKRPRAETVAAAPPPESTPAVVGVSPAASSDTPALELPSPLPDVPKVAVTEVAVPPLPPPPPPPLLPIDLPAPPLPELPELPVLP